ncbi:MAG: hypothetical protein IPK89_13490 [Sphingomonadales bacterium]|nr:hypothetical protein [Sphingomonadales bacterium]
MRFRTIAGLLILHRSASVFRCCPSSSTRSILTPPLRGITTIIFWLFFLSGIQLLFIGTWGICDSISNQVRGGPMVIGSELRQCADFACTFEQRY